MDAFKGLPYTVVMNNRDYSEWHKNREHYAVWVIDFDEEAILDEIDRARHFFKDMLLTPFKRQPHISLFVSGFWADVTVHDDDYPSNLQQAHRESLAQSRLKPFDIQIGGINSFASALYFDVLDSTSGITQVREILAKAMPELRWAPYIPHITIGLYKDTISTQAVIDRINSYQHLPVMHKNVRDIKLITYRSDELIGPLTTRYTHILSI